MPGREEGELPSADEGAATSQGGRRGTGQSRLSKYTQQEIPAWRPLLKPRHVVTIFFFVGAIFVPLGALILTAALSVCLQTQTG